MTERERIGARIKELRESKGLSVQELAIKVEMQRPNISRIEAGKYSTGIDILAKIATALDKRIDFV